MLRHENEISGTTDVGSRPEFADRRATKTIDGQRLTGWFTEDFTWAEISTLRARERLPNVRATSASFDDAYGVLRLSDLLELVDVAAAVSGRRLGVVVEVKHATYFDSVGLPLDRLLADTLAEAGWASRPGSLVIEAFEETVLGCVRDRGVVAEWVYLLEATGSPADRLAAEGADSPTYDDYLTDAGLAALAGRVDGISVDKSRLLPTDEDGIAMGTTDLVDRAHAAGLSVFCWTLRPENRFLPVNFRYGGGPAQFGNYESEWERIVRTGVDGIFADHPDLAVAVLDGM